MSDDKLPMWIDPETVRQLLRGAKPDAPIQERLRNPPKPYRPVALREEAAARIDALEAQLAEARRRRDEWRKKAEGYDEVRRALREKVGSPWPPHMSRALWAGIAADEKKRADDAEAQLAEAVEALERIAAYNVPAVGRSGAICSHGRTLDYNCHCCTSAYARATLAKIKGAEG